MEPKIIKSEKDYNGALKRIESLMDKNSLNKRESDELELLGTLVSIYEDKKWPILPPNPVDAIRFRMEQMGLSRNDLEIYIGNKSKVSEVLAGKRSLSKQMIYNLHKGLGIPLESLMGVVEESEQASEIKKQFIDWLKYPIKEMIKRNWIEETEVKKDSHEYMNVMKTFAYGLGNDSLAPVMLKSGKAYNKRPDPYALAAWRIRVLSLAKERKLKSKFDSRLLTSTYLNELSRLSSFDQGPLLAKEFLSKIGIHLIIEHHLKKTYLDGASMMLSNGSPIVALTLRFDRLDNFWFVLFHELAHIELHLSGDKSRFFMENFDNISTDEEELQADKWATDSLIPEKTWKLSNLTSRSHDSDIIDFAKKLRINPAIPAGRIRRETRNYTLFSHLVGNKKVKSLFL